MQPRLLLTTLTLLAVVACQEDAGTPTESTAPTQAVAATAALAFRQVSAGDTHTCGVTTDDRAYCWGENSNGELGNGTRLGPEHCEEGVVCSTRPVAVLGGLRFKTVNHVNSLPSPRADRPYRSGNLARVLLLEPGVAPEWSVEHTSKGIGRREAKPDAEGSDPRC